MRNVCLLLMIFVFLSSCKKVEENPEEEHEVIQNAYYPLQTGNYWVYEFQTHLPDGTISGDPVIDSLIIVGDTLIENKTFSVLNTNRPIQNSVWYLRDSSGYVLSKNGSTSLPPFEQTGLFNDHYGTFSNGDTIYYYYDRFPDVADISTYVGSEQCLAQYSTHENYPVIGGNTVVDTSYYAAFGPVQRSYAFSSGAKMIGTLIDHHLE